MISSSPSAHSGGSAPNPVRQIIDALQRPLDGSVEVELRPADLGRVRLTFTPLDGTLMVSLSADRPETLDFMRRNIDQLAQDLRQFGYERTGFDFESAANGRGKHDRAGGASDSESRNGPTAMSAVADTRSLGQPITRATGLDLRI